MTVDELRVEIGQDMKCFGEKLEQLSSDFSGLRSTVEAGGERARDEISVLFARARDHADRISAVERDYTPRLKHDETEKRVVALETGLATSRGTLIAVLTLIQLLGMGGIVAILKALSL